MYCLPSHIGKHRKLYQRQNPKLKEIILKKKSDLYNG